MRPTLRLSSPDWFDAPNTTSSTWSSPMSVRSSTARITCAARSSGPDLRERAAVAADGRAHVAEDHGIARVATHPLSSLELRGSLGRERPDALGVVLRATGAILQRRLQLEERREVAVPRRVEPFLRERVRLGRSFGQRRSRTSATRPRTRRRATRASRDRCAALRSRPPGRRSGSCPSLVPNPTMRGRK